MNKSSKLFLVTMAVAAATMSAQETTTASSDPTKFSLTVQNGSSSGNYAAGVLVTVSADAPKAGAQFAGWMGDVAILANPSLPTTTATIPFMAVTITATYTAPAGNLTPAPGPASPAAPAAKSISRLHARWEG